MTSLDDKAVNPIARRLYGWWVDHRALLLRIAIVFMSIASLVWLSYEFWRLVWQSDDWGAIDLRILHAGVNTWMRGVDLYQSLWGAAYPPATFVILWPFLGWLAVEPARWFWAATTLIALLALIYLILNASGAESLLERVFVALMPLSIYATGATIGNGQLGVHVLSALVAGVLLLSERHNWSTDLFAAFLILFSLAKPSTSIPFFWIVLFVPRRLGPALLIAVAYIAVTLFAGSFQQSGLIVLVQEWLGESSMIAASWGTANLSIGLASIGLREWILPATLIALTILGVWIWLHRQDDLWLLLGVTALVARFWTHHSWYDDLLILLPMVTLFRIAKRNPYADESDVIAGALLGATLLLMLAPGGLYLFPAPWNSIYLTAQVIDWVAILIFLFDRSRRIVKSASVSKSSRVSPDPAR